MFFEELKTISNIAKEEGVTLRLIGSLAFRIRSDTAKKMAKSRPLTDLDFVSYKKDRNKIEALFARLGYTPDQTFNMLHGRERLVFFGRNGELKVDVWLEEFKMAHSFNFKDRLKFGDWTLPLADLLMTKLQIVELNEKDVRDVICLLLDHDLSENDEDLDRINLKRLTGECRTNWGTYKTFTMNLEKIKGLCPRYLHDEKLPQIVADRIERILNTIEAAPKTLAWNIRGKVGESRRWYETPDVR